MELTYLVTIEDDGQRAVDVLASRTKMSRLLCKKVRLYGSLTRNGLPHRMIDPVRAGDLLVASYSPHGPGPLVLRQPAGLQILFKDEWLLAVNKPAGLITHPTHGHASGTLTDLLSDRPLHPIGRLDRETSGLVLIGLNGHAHNVVSQQPQKKYYLALAHGRLPQKNGLIDAPIRRAEDSIIRREIHPAGARAMTIWQELNYYRQWDISMIKLQLITGRTHQIRLHLLYCGCPLVGDSLYAGSRPPGQLDKLLGRQALHAMSSQFLHPVSGRQITLAAPLPKDLRQLLDHLRRQP